MGNQIKSKQRVKDFAEVFTNEREVKAMCDLIPQEVWQDITKTFLEPACGNGAFLKEIFARKLEYCKTEKDGLKALNSIYGIDIQQDNVDESREMLLNMFYEKFKYASVITIELAICIIAKRIICGDSLKIMAQWEKEINHEPIQLSFFINKETLK